MVVHDLLQPIQLLIASLQQGPQFRNGEVLVYSIIVLLLLLHWGPLIAEVIVLAPQTDGLLHHLVHSSVCPMRDSKRSCSLNIVITPHCASLVLSRASSRSFVAHPPWTSI